MAFFMRCWKRLDLTACLVAALLLGTAAGALAAGIEVRSAELVAVEDAWQLNADFDISLSAEIEEALNKGVALTFLVEFELAESHRYWFDDEVASATRRVKLSYHPLSRQYLINVGTHQKSFASLVEAKDELGKLRGWAVLEKSQVRKGDLFYAILRMRLDQARLPKALQVDALGSETWELVSERHRWVPALNGPELPSSTIK